MIEQLLKIESERRKMFLEFATKAFPEAKVEEISLPPLNQPDGWGIAIRINKPNDRSIIIRPRRPVMTDTNANFLQIFLEGIQTAKHILNNPPLKEQDFQGTLILNHKGVENFLKGEKADPV